MKNNRTSQSGRKLAKTRTLIVHQPKRFDAFDFPDHRAMLLALLNRVAHFMDAEVITQYAAFFESPRKCWEIIEILVKKKSLMGDMGISGADLRKLKAWVWANEPKAAAVETGEEGGEG